MKESPAASVATMATKFGLNFRALWIYILATGLTSLICASVWPGFMTFDSLAILHQARFGIQTNHHPPMVAYVQWLCERICPGPGAFFACQVGLFFLAVADILVVSGVALSLSIASLLYIALCPALLGPLTCVWKDTGMAAFFMASFAATARAEIYPNGKKTWAWLGMFFIFMGCMFRYNALLSAIPLIVASVSHSFGKTTLRRATVSFVAIAIIGAAIILVGTFRLPDMERIHQGYHDQTIEKFDIVGIGAISGDLSLIEPRTYAKYPDFSIDDLKRNYFPQCFDMTYSFWRSDQKPLDHWTLTPKQLTNLWIASIKKHPDAYLKHRWEVFKGLLDIGHDHAYYISSGGTEANDEGVELHQTRLTKLVMSYLIVGKGWLICMPWLYYLLGVVIFCAIRRLRIAAARADLLLVSAFSLLVPLVFTASTADIRYHLWAIAAIILSVVLTLNAWFVARRNQSLASTVDWRRILG